MHWGTPAVVLLLMETFCSSIWDDQQHNIPGARKAEFNFSWLYGTAGLRQFWGSYGLYGNQALNCPNETDLLFVTRLTSPLLLIAISVAGGGCWYVSHKNEGKKVKLLGKLCSLVCLGRDFFFKFDAYDFFAQVRKMYTGSM